MNLRWASLLAVLLAPATVRASFLSVSVDTVANWPSCSSCSCAGGRIAGFLFVHVLPEKIAEKRHHPHKDSIKTLCILSLFFGGMLWPFAWLWAYTRPMGHRMIYGTEKHEDYYLEMAEELRAGRLPASEVAHLRAELAVMESNMPLRPSCGSSRKPGPLPSIAPAHAVPLPAPRVGRSRRGRRGN